MTTATAQLTEETTTTKRPQVFTTPNIATVYTRLFPDTFVDQRWNKKVTAFVTQILGTDPQYGFRRVFPLPVATESDGTRIYSLIPGAVYQIKRVLRKKDEAGNPVGEKFALSRFYQVAYDFTTGNGHLVELDQAAVEHLAASMDEKRAGRKADQLDPAPELTVQANDTPEGDVPF